ncbi:arylsulfatase [Haloferula sp. BvORR071]|uniref:arylsulfatase n=1 Tax=Haloferula sp. BvORR071 TaxID=1396141 RepID=UPI0006983729|nr:arylsulfatase [Haloferula sp. BvORR071]
MFTTLRHRLSVRFGIIILPALLTAGPALAEETAPKPARPNVIVILADDLGWSDLGCYGSEIPTPNLDALAAGGVRFRQFYNSARCSPTRCSLLTGLYPQQAAVKPAAPLPNLRNDNNITFAELLKSEGYRTYMAGKWHLGNGELLPENRGFDHAFRFANGGAHSTDNWRQENYTLVSKNQEIAFRDYKKDGGTFYQSDAIGDYATDFIKHSTAKHDGTPFAIYIAFGAPHFPIQAPAALADTFMPIYSKGWDLLQRERYERQLASGVIDKRYPMPSRGGAGPKGGEQPEIPAWTSLPAERRNDMTRRMALYAAMIKKLDDNVGKVVAQLRETKQFDNTLIFFMSDNGANYEGGVFGATRPPGRPGAAGKKKQQAQAQAEPQAKPRPAARPLEKMGQPGQNDDISIGGAWAHLGNTPLKYFKHFTHEGGIRAPLIVHWPAGVQAHGAWVETPSHLVDVMKTITDVTGAKYPATYKDHPVLPAEGISLIPAIRKEPVAERPIFVEHESNRMIRKGKWKLVTENFNALDKEFKGQQTLLYDMEADPGEATDLAAKNPDKVKELTAEWNTWSKRVGLPPARLIGSTPESGTAEEDD